MRYLAALLVVRTEDELLLGCINTLQVEGTGGCLRKLAAVSVVPHASVAGDTRAVGRQRTRAGIGVSSWSKAVKARLARREDHDIVGCLRRGHLRKAHVHITFYVP